MLGRFLAGSLLLLSLVVAALLLLQANRSEAASGPVEAVSVRRVSAPPPAAARRAPAVAPARALDAALASDDLRAVCRAAAVLRLAGLPEPAAARDRLLDAFLDGRLDFAGPWALARLAELPPREQAALAARARNLDRSIVAMKDAPPALVRALVASAEDPSAHLEAARAVAPRIRALVADPALGRKAWALLAATDSATLDDVRSLTFRIADDEWARAEIAALGGAAVAPLVERCSSADPLLRSAAAWLLALAGGESLADTVVHAAVPGLKADDVAGNARYSIRALAALGERARPVARLLLRSHDDQAAAAALDVLRRCGGASDAEVEASRPVLERLSTSDVDESSLAAELLAALKARGAVDVPGAPAPLSPGQVPSSGTGR